MRPTVTIEENSALSCSLSATDVDDLPHIRRLLLQAVFSVEGNEGESREHPVSLAKLHLLRGFLASVGCDDSAAARRLLLIALLQLEDEDDESRFVMPHAVLPLIVKAR